MCIGWLTCISQSLRPHFLCRSTTGNTSADRQMPIALVVSTNFKKENTMTDEEMIEAIKKVKGISGMTLNERLYVTGLMTEFDKSKKSDKEKAKRILELLGLDRLSIDKIVK